MGTEDRQLIDQLLAGDVAAYRTVDEWIQRAMGKYRRLLGNDAEDLAQEILIGVTQDLRDDKFGGRSALRTYVTSRVYYTCIDELRSRRRREWVDLEHEELQSHEPSPLQRLGSRRKIELARQVLEQMPASCRELWRDLQDGLGYEEMSRKHGVSRVTLRSRVLRCRRRAQDLRSRLQEKIEESVQRNPPRDD